MNEQQVRDRITEAADTIDCSPVPLTAIRSTGRTFARRRGADRGFLRRRLLRRGVGALARADRRHGHGTAAPVVVLDRVGDVSRTQRVVADLRLRVGARDPLARRAQGFALER